MLNRRLLKYSDRNPLSSQLNISERGLPFSQVFGNILDVEVDTAGYKAIRQSFIHRTFDQFQTQHWQLSDVYTFLVIFLCGDIMLKNCFPLGINDVPGFYTVMS